MNILQIGFFPFPVAPGRKTCSNSHSAYHPVLPSHTAKAPKVDIQQVPLTTVVATHTSTTPRTSKLFYAFSKNFLGVFWSIWWRHQKMLLEMVPKLPTMKKSTLRGILRKCEIQLDVRCALSSGSSYICKGSKNPLLVTASNWLFWH